MIDLDALKIVPGSSVDLSAFDPGATLGLDKDEAERRLARNVASLADLQYDLWAENRHAVLVVLQGMDASGKDGVVRHVFSGINPAGVRVTSFKAPTPLELDHDFLWRVHRVVPGRGEIGVFNRSHYEDVLVVRVDGLAPEREWRSRYDRINAFEQLLVDGGVTILKFFLHLSRQEQRERLVARARDERKHWKFSEDDLRKHGQWDEYAEAYREMLERCSTAHAPWIVVPADRKWVRNAVVSEAVERAIGGLAPKLPRARLDAAQIERVLLDAASA